MNPILYYTRRYKDHIFVYILVWLFFTLMFVESAFGRIFMYQGISYIFGISMMNQIMNQIGR